MNKTIICVLIFSVIGCEQTTTTKIDIDENKQARILIFAKSLFSKELMDSKNTLDSLQLLTNRIMEDTTEYVRTPKATLFISNSTNTYFQVFEKPKGTITAIAFYLNDNRFYAAEYFKNGQVMCKFSVSGDGKRNGPYICYNEDGTYRTLGYYKNDKEIADSVKRFDK